MPVCFLHTADWQLGKPFASINDDAKRHRLQQERIHAIQRIAQLAQKTNPAFVLVAGDLFDSPHVTKATVSAACSALDTAILFPAPLLRRHESRNPTAWIREAVLDPSLPADLPRIVLAYGTIQGFGSLEEDEDGGLSLANWIDLASLPADHIDYMALGDWHGTKQVGPKAWYCGTPEIDRFPKGDGNDPGNILKVTASRGQAPQVEKISTGRFSWKEHTFHFTGDSSLDLFSSQLDELFGKNGDEHLLLLTLEGSLGIAASDHLEKILESLESRLVRLKLDSRVTIAPSEQEIANLTRRTEDPLIATVELLTHTGRPKANSKPELARVHLEEAEVALEKARENAARLAHAADDHARAERDIAEITALLPKLRDNRSVTETKLSTESKPPPRRAGPSPSRPISHHPPRRTGNPRSPSPARREDRRTPTGGHKTRHPQRDRAKRPRCQSGRRTILERSPRNASPQTQSVLPPELFLPLLGANDIASPS